MMNQPDPKTVAEMKLKEAELQTRLKMGEMKSQTEVQTTQIETMGRLQETGERSARDILKLLGAPKEKEDESSGGKGSSKD